MKDLGKIVLHIPAREGSKRVPKKNMRSMNGNPMISYTIRAALDSKTTNQIYINTDAEEIMAYVREEFPEVKIYERDKKLANDKASSDEFNLDIIEKLKPDTLIMINPVCPLITADDIANAVNCFKKEPCDTLISASSTKMQSFCDNRRLPNIQILLSFLGLRLKEILNDEGIDQDEVQFPCQQFLQVLLVALPINYLSGNRFQFIPVGIILNGSDLSLAGF